MEHLIVPFETKSIDENNDFFEFEGYAATFGNIDLGNDKIIKGAFKKSINEINSNASLIEGTNFKSLIPLLWQHNITEPIGTFINLKEDDKGLFVNVIMPKNDTFVSGRVMPQMKIKSIRKMSIGFVTKDYEMNDKARELKEIDLKESSLVTFPMNEEANITDFKAATQFENLPLADTGMRWDSTAAKNRVKEWANATEKPNERYKRAFLWYDQNEPDLFGSYKLPFADIIDGKLKAIPRGVFAAAAAVRGARGGVNIPQGDRAGVISHIEKYYDKMDRPSPFKEKSIIKIDDLSVIDERLFENLLMGGVCMSEKDAKKITSYVKDCLCRDGINDKSCRDGMKDNQMLESMLSQLKQIKI